MIRDFGRVSEIAWPDRWHAVPLALLARTLNLVGGLPWLAAGFCLATTTLAHATFAINTVNHLSWTGLAWNLQPVPARIYDEARHGVAPAVLAGAGDA